MKRNLLILSLIIGLFSISGKKEAEYVKNWQLKTMNNIHNISISKQTLFVIITNRVTFTKTSRQNRNKLNINKLKSKYFIELLILSFTQMNTLNLFYSGVGRLERLRRVGAGVGGNVGCL